MSNQTQQEIAPDNNNKVISVQQVDLTDDTRDGPPDDLRNSDINQDVDNDDRKELLMSNVQLGSNSEIKISSYRWVMLLCICGNIFSNCILMVGLSTVSTQVAQGFNIPQVWVVMLALMFLILYVPFSLVAIWAYQKFKLSLVLRSISILQIIACWFRLFMQINNQFWILFMATFFDAICMPFFLNAMGIIPFAWFPTHEQGKAIGMISLSLPVGALIAFVLPVFFLNSNDDTTAGLNQNSDSFYHLILTQNILITLMSGPQVIFSKSEPDHPPSEEAKERLLRRSFAPSQKSLKGDRNYALVAISFTTLYSLYMVGGSIISQLLSKWYDPLEVTEVSVCIIISGMICTPVAGFLIDKYKKQLFMAKIMTFSSFIVLVILTITAHYGKVWIMCLGFFIFGAFLIPIVPVLFSFACRITAPCQPSIVTGFMLMFTTGYSAIFGIACVFVCQNTPEVAIGMFAASSLISFIASMLVNAEDPAENNEYKRLSMALRKSQNEGFTDN